MAPRWSNSDRIRFILSYAVGKLLIPIDVTRPRLAFWWFELRYSLVNLINSIVGPVLRPVLYRGPSVVETRHESFEVRPGTQDAAIVSPAFERDDQTHLFGLLKRLTAAGPVDFVDVGANIGQYAVRVPRRTAGDVRVWAVEPIAPNRALLERNLARNGLRDIEVLPVALSDRAGELPMTFDESQSGDASLVTEETERTVRVRVARGDDVLTGLRDDAHRVFKIDVEKHEVATLRGLVKSLAGGRGCEVCIEDVFDRSDIYAELAAQGFSPTVKLTPYNSWWARRALGK